MKEKLLSLKNKPVILLAVAAVLLLVSTVGATQAAITATNKDSYTAKMQAPTLSVSLLENQGTEEDSFVEIGKSVILSKMLDQSNGKLIPGKIYKEELKVQNDGDTDAYVRVVITKNWLDADGKPDRMLSPKNIKLVFDDQGEWIVDASASTSERTVLYYKNILSAKGGVTPVFLETLQVQNGFDLIVKEEKVSESNGYKVIEYSHPYDGYSMNISVEVDAVQTYDAAEAIKSAWGVEATLADGVITEIK